MSITNIGKNRVYVSIKDLPETQRISNGDKLIIQTDTDTMLLDYENVKIDLEHTTFASQITSVIEYSSTVTSFIEQINADVESVKEETATLKNQMSSVQSQMDCVKFMIKLIMGYGSSWNSEFINQMANTTLSDAGLQMYNECMASMDGKNFDFSYYNLYSARV